MCHLTRLGVTDAALDSLTARFAVEARAPLQAHLAVLFPEETSV
jgi:hypothetical protein